jgi:hypothetical protein
MVNPDKNNKRIFRILIVVMLAVFAFAAWLVISSTTHLK